MQLDAFAAAQFDGGQANRVRAPRRSGRKHPMRPIVGGRCTEQFEPMYPELRGAIELPDDDEMREALDVGEPRLKLGQYPEHTVGLVFSAKALGNLAHVLIRTTHKSNRPRGKHTGQCLSKSHHKSRMPHPFHVLCGKGGRRERISHKRRSCGSVAALVTNGLLSPCGT